MNVNTENLKVAYTSIAKKMDLPEQRFEASFDNAKWFVDYGQFKRETHMLTDTMLKICTALSNPETRREIWDDRVKFTIG